MTGTEAERFAAAYTALRAREPWAEKDRSRRDAAVADAVRTIRSLLGKDALIVDVGAGVHHVPGVITVDLLRVADLQADLRALPFADGSVDGALYAASLHYAPIAVAVAEAGRILRPGGVLIAIDSPLYADATAAAAAKARSEAYYASNRVPELAAHYHPIEVGSLRRALAANGLELSRLTRGSGWARLLGQGPRSFVLARKLR